MSSPVPDPVCHHVLSITLVEGKEVIAFRPLTLPYEVPASLRSEAGQFDWKRWPISLEYAVRKGGILNATGGQTETTAKGTRLDSTAVSRKLGGPRTGHHPMGEKQSQTASHYPCQAGRGLEAPIEDLTLDNGSLRLDTVILDPELPTQLQAVSQFSEEERNALNIRMRNLVTG